MAKKERSPDPAEQPALPGTAQRRYIGPIERSLAKALRAAREREDITDQDHAAVAAARSTARLVDWCERNREPHTQTLAVKQLSELLTKLRLEPSSRGSGVTPDGWDAAAADLGTPAGGDAQV